VATLAPTAAAPTAHAMRSGFLPERIVHLHVTRLCNLACAHCYSSSGPRERGALDAAELADALPRLRAEGYTQLSLSGGEPLAYRDLPKLVEHALAGGWRVTMVTNGLLASPAHDALFDRLAGIAISFDGLAERHDRMRGRRGAHAGALAALARLASRDLPVGAAVSIARDGLPELPELIERLVGHGARAVQIRPIARAGRANALERAATFRAADRARLFLVAEALRHELSARVHVDLSPSSALWEQRDAYAALLAACRDRCAEEPCPLSDLVNPLVVTETGVLRPVTYDFDARYDLGTLAQPSRDAIADFAALVGRELVALQRGFDFVDWFDRLARASLRRSPAQR
jgi:Fe-coproporphyrin III synthase